MAEPAELFPDQTPDQFTTFEKDTADNSKPDPKMGGRFLEFGVDSIGDNTVTPTNPPGAAPNAFLGLDKSLEYVMNNYQRNLDGQKEADAYATKTGALGDDYNAHLPERKELLSQLKVPKAAPAPMFQERSPIEALGSLGAVVGAFGSLFSRRPMTSALKSMAAGMDALYKGDVDHFNREYKTWEDQTNLALKQADLENGIVKTILDDDSKSWDQKLNLLKGYGSALNDKRLFNDAAAGDIRQLIGINEKKIEVTQRMQERMMSMSPEQLIFWKNRQEFTKKEGREPTAAEELEIAKTLNPNLAKEGERQRILASDPDWLSNDPQRMAAAERRATEAMSPYTAAMGDPRRVALNAFIEQYKAEHNGEYPPAQAIAAFNASSAPARSAPAMAMRKYMEEHPEATSDQISEFGANYAARNKAVSAFASGKQGDIVRSFSTVAEHVGTLERLGKALENGDSQAFNRLSNAWATQFGQAAPVNFETAKNIVGAEIVKAIVGAGGGVSDREKAQSVIDKVNSPDQLAGSLATIKELVHGQLVGLEKQFVDTTTLGAADPEAARAKARETFKNRLSGKALELYDDKNTAKPSLPAEAKKQLVAGKVTTFGNGQRWTLDASGEPVQVQ